MKLFSGKKKTTITYISRNALGVEKEFAESDLEKIKNYGVRRKSVPNRMGY